MPSIEDHAAVRAPVWRAFRDVPRFVDRPVRPFPGLSDRLANEPYLAHDFEPRDESWAPAIEASMGRRWNARELAQVGLADVSITQIDCRSVTCMLVYEFPARVSEVLVANGLPGWISPLALLEERSGPPAPRNLGWRRREITVAGQPWVQMSAVFSFDDASYDPDRYDGWVESRLPLAREVFRKMRAPRPQADRPHAG